MSPSPIFITRGRGGQVEVDGPVDAFASAVLARAGFLTFPILGGVWIRLPFDLGPARENQHASWAADMLAAARYKITPDPSLRTDPSHSGRPPEAAHTPGQPSAHPLRPHPRRAPVTDHRRANHRHSPRPQQGHLPTTQLQNRLSPDPAPQRPRPR